MNQPDNTQAHTNAGRVAFKMKLVAGKAAEYQQRHDKIWPELKDLLKQAGVKQYSIFLDEEDMNLIGVLYTEDETALAALPAKEIMKRWWSYMADIMETNPDNSPVTTSLKEVFYLP